MTKDISLKAACADTFHYPPEWDPTQGSLDAFQRRRGFEHHFGRQRTKNLHKGILQIRFEMPFKVQCLRCQTYIGQGTRYDADKKKVGNYFSSPIYEFEMRCGVVVGHRQSADGRIYCNEKFVIRTDPKNDNYELASGLRKKVETWDPKSSETIELADPETKRKMQSDPMFKVEQTIRNTTKEKSDKERLRDLHELQMDREDAYALNSVLRKAHRQKRKEIEAEEEAIRKAGPQNFCLPLEPACEDDAREAAAVHFRTDSDKVEVSARRAALRAAPLFAGLEAPRHPSSSSTAGLSPSQSSSNRVAGTTTTTTTTLLAVAARGTRQQIAGESLAEVSTTASSLGVSLNSGTHRKRKRGSSEESESTTKRDPRDDVGDDDVADERSRRLDLLLRGSSNSGSSSRLGLGLLPGNGSTKGTSSSRDIDKWRGQTQSTKMKASSRVGQVPKSQQMQELVAKRRRLAQHALMAKAFG